MLKQQRIQVLPINFIKRHRSNRKKYLDKSRRLIWKFMRLVFLLGFSFIIMYPILNIVSKAFMHRVDLFDNTVVWIPKHFTFTNIRLAASLMDYGTAFRNSLVLSTVTTLLQTFMCLVIGYGFARFKFPLKNVLFSFVILTILVPPQLIMVSIFIHFRFFDIFGIIKLLTGTRGINMMDTFIPSFLLALTGMGIKNGLFIYIFRQFFRGMPKELEEAAYVDGSGPFRTFYKIMAPSAITAIVTVFLFSFVWQWNDDFYSGMFLKNNPVLPLTYRNITFLTAEIISRFGNPEFAKYDLSHPMIMGLIKNTVVFLIIAPLIVLYAFAQRYFVESIERTGLVE